MEKLTEDTKNILLEEFELGEKDLKRLTVIMDEYSELTDEPVYYNEVALIAGEEYATQMFLRKNSEFYIVNDHLQCSSVLHQNNKIFVGRIIKNYFEERNLPVPRRILEDEEKYEEFIKNLKKR